MKTQRSMSHGSINLGYEENKLSPDYSNVNKFAILAQMVVKQDYRVRYLKNVSRMYEGR